MKKLLLFLLFLPFAVSATAEANLATVFHPETGHRKVVVIGDEHAFDGGYLLEIARVRNLSGGENLGFSVVSNYQTTLSSSMTSSQATIPVSSVTTKDSHVLTMGDIGSKVFLVIEPGANKEEIVMCTGISGTTWTGCTRGLAFYGTSTASVAANRKTHNSGATVVMSNVHYVYDESVDKDSAETIAGLKTFSTYPQIGTYAAPTVDEQFAVKKYVDDVTNAGAADATETVKGISELATGAEAAAGTSAGGTSARLVLPASLATSTCSETGNHIPVTGSDGKVAGTCIAQDDNYTWSGANSSTGSNSFTGSTTISDANITQLDINSTLLTSSAAELNKLDGASANVTATNLNTLTAGSNAESLHGHYSYDSFKNLSEAGTPYIFISGTNTFTDNITSGSIIDYIVYSTIRSNSPVGSDAIATKQLGHDASGGAPYNIRDVDISVAFSAEQYKAAAQDVFLGLHENNLAAVPADATNTDDHYGFFIQDGTLYASNANGTTQTKTDISSGITVTDNHFFEIVIDAGTDVKFYVDGTLKATHTTNLTSGSGALYLVFGNTSQGTADSGTVLYNGIALKMF